MDSGVLGRIHYTRNSFPKVIPTRSGPFLDLHFNPTIRNTSKPRAAGHSSCRFFTDLSKSFVVFTVHMHVRDNKG